MVNYSVPCLRDDIQLPRNTKGESCQGSKHAWGVRSHASALTRELRAWLQHWGCVHQGRASTDTSLQEAFLQAREQLKHRRSSQCSDRRPRVTLAGTAMRAKGSSKKHRKGKKNKPAKGGRAGPGTGQEAGGFKHIQPGAVQSGESITGR